MARARSLQTHRRVQLIAFLSLIAVSMRHSVWILSICSLLTSAVACTAQQQATTGERVVLQSHPVRAESTADTRLDEGDFHPGDRITLWVNGEPSLSSTFTVRAGNTLVIPTLQEISLQGVHRSELRELLLREVSRYIKNPEIQVSTLVNVAILGAVGRPGFYAVSPDTPITDVLMTAGGPAANADLGRSQIMRDGAVLANATKLRQLLEANSALDASGVRSGDQIIVGQTTQHWQTVTTVVGLVSVMATTLLLLRHR